MQILSASQLETVKTKSRLGFTRTRSSWIEELLNTMDKVDVGDGFTVLKSEWPGKTKPGSAITGYLKQRKSYKKFTTSQMADNSGWVIKRIK